MANTVFSTATNVTLSGGGLVATATGASAVAQSPDFRKSGKFAVEFTFNVRSAGNTAAGLARAETVYSGANPWTWGVCVYQSGNVYFNGSATPTGSLGVLADNDKISVEIDFTTGAASARRNGGAAVLGVVSDVAYLAPTVQFNASGQQITLNSGDTAFTYPPTTGYTAGWPAPGDPTVLMAAGLGAEVFGAQNTSQLWVSQLGVEVWRATADVNPSSLLVTQLVTTVWRTVANAPPPSTARRRRPILVSSFGPAS